MEKVHFGNDIEFCVVQIGYVIFTQISIKTKHFVILVGKSAAIAMLTFDRFKTSNLVQHVKLYHY